MKRTLVAIFLLAAAGCDRGTSSSPTPAPATPEQGAEATWKTWQASMRAADGNAAWGCLSQRTRAERSALYKADVARVKTLTGAALEAEARLWGIPSATLAAMDSEKLAAAALGREFRRSGAETPAAFAGVVIKGEVAIVTAKRADGRSEAVAMVREENTWRLDDAESRRILGR